MTNTSLHNLLNQVESEESLLSFVDALIEDRASAVMGEKDRPARPYGPGARGWENTSIEAFLEAACAWARASKSGLSQGRAGCNPWRRFAEFLYAGKIYE